MTTLPSTRAEALAIGSSSYFTGKPCKHGHIAKRYTPWGHCCACRRILDAKTQQRWRAERRPSFMAGRVNIRKRHDAKPEHKVKLIARQRTADALQAGKLLRGNCERCGSVPAQAHHDDYSKPLSVRWLCSTCHAAEHSRLRVLGAL